MNLLKRIFAFEFVKYFLVFIVVHLLLFNINVAEWGDSYRIMRAAAFISHGDYPSDEKRPPVFAATLALKPAFIDPTQWGRVVVLLFSIASFFVFWKLVEKHINDKRNRFFAMILFIFNPVYLYWSLRVMTDIPFGFFVLLAIYLFDIWKDKLNIKNLLALGVIAGVSIMTRFEGYLLAFALAFGIFHNGDNFLEIFKNIKTTLRKHFSYHDFYFVGLALILVPYFIWRNPFTSSYLEEPAGRSYDLKMVLIYTASLLFLFGFVPSVTLFFQNFKSLTKTVTKNYAMAMFVLLELVLCLAWPAAIPRLFVPFIPFVILYLAVSVDFSKKPTRLFLLGSFITLIIYVLAQYYLKLQFLVLIKWVFFLNIFIQSLTILAFYKSKIRLFFGLLFVGLILWSWSTIYIHKDIFISVKNGAEFAGKDFTGNIAYNDVSSVSDWYINYQYKAIGKKGFYYNTEKKQNLDLQSLKNAHIDYLLITNEHNTTMTLDLGKRPYLEEIREFRYNVNGAEFFTKFIRVKN